MTALSDQPQQGRDIVTEVTADAGHRSVFEGFRASEGFDTWATGAASKQSVGLAGLPGFFLLALALVRRIRLLFNAGLRLSSVFADRCRLILELADHLGGSRSVDRAPFPQDQAVSNE